MAVESDINHIQTQTQQLLQKLGIQAQISISLDQDTKYYHIQIDSDTPGLLIGYRGETLASFQLILGLIINQPANIEKQDQVEKQWKKIIVNVGDYRQRREQTLVQLAQNAAQRVKFSGEPYVFEHLSPAERRIIHLSLQSDDQVTTYSEGEGRNRHLVVALK